MRLRAFLTDVLANLKFAQLLDHIRAHHQTDQQSRKRSEGGAEGEIAEDPEWPEVRKELLIEQPVKQTSSAHAAVERRLGIAPSVPLNPCAQVGCSGSAGGQ